MEFIKTLHIIGYKNSGKTTLMNHWIGYLKSFDYKVVAIKHHGHGARLAMPDEGKDSMQYIQHGADVSLVSGGGHTQQIIQQESSFQELMELAARTKPDVILVEEYKDEVGEKVALVSSDEEWESLQKIDGISLVVGEVEATGYEQISSRNYRDQLDTWLRTWLREA